MNNLKYIWIDIVIDINELRKRNKLRDKLIFTACKQVSGTRKTRETQFLSFFLYVPFKTNFMNKYLYIDFYYLGIFKIL